MNQPNAHKEEAFRDAGFYLFLIVCNIQHGQFSMFSSQYVCKL